MITVRSGAWRLLLPLGLVTFAAGCLTTPEQAQPASSPTELQNQVFKLQKDTSRILEKLEVLEGQLGAAEDPETNVCAEAVTRVEELSREVSALEEQFLSAQMKLDETLLQLRELRRLPGASGSSEWQPQLGGAYARRAPRDERAAEAAPTGEPDADEPAGADEAGGELAVRDGDRGAPSAAPDELFNAAYADFSRGNFDLALAGFEAAVEADPEGPIAKTAQYYIGETLLAMERYPDAVEAFDRLITAYPDGERLATAHLKKGIALFEARRTVEGAQTLQHVIETWPRSDEARIAEEYFRRKGIIQD
jgi:TolA-binding protein